MTDDKLIKEMLETCEVMKVDSPEGATDIEIIDAAFHRLLKETVIWNSICNAQEIRIETLEKIDEEAMKIVALLDDKKSVHLHSMDFDALVDAHKVYKDEAIVISKEEADG